MLRLIAGSLGGYLCSVYASLVLTAILLYWLPMAEAVFLADFIAILFCIIFFIGAFVINSHTAVLWLSTSLTLLFFLLSKVI